MPGPQDLTNGDQAKAMADLTQQLATLITAFGQFVQNPATPTATTPANSSNGMSQLVESIASRIPNFSYDPEEDKTFDGWWGRYEEIITKDGSSLTDDAKARFVLSKLDSKEYSHFSNRVLPATPNSLKFEELIPKLKDTFKSTSSVFRKRQEFLRMEYDGSSIEEYTGQVLRRFTSSEFKKMTDDQTCCMVWINGLRDSAYTDIRTKALQILESKPATTLLELEQEIKKLLDIREDSKSVCRIQQPAEVNAINRKPSTDKSQKPQKPPPPSPCFKCSGNHWAKECQKKVTCQYCQKNGHIEKFCRSKLKVNQSPKGKIKSVIIGSATHSKVNRIYRTVSINGTPLKMQLDTGADVTLISTKDWIRLGRPSLQTPTIQVKSANHQPIAVKGTFTCQFNLNGTFTSGMAHVAETGTLLGTDWISKDPHLWQILNANQISKVSSGVGSACNDLDNMREGLKAELNKQFSDVFKPELGHCTKTKASLVLKPDAQPVFRKSRPVPFAAVSTVTEELDRLQKAGVISPIDHSDWAAPIVLVKKKNGSLRMCADFSTGLNDAIQLHQHPLPTADDIFATLNGGKFFSQIDLAEAYFQIELDEEAKKMLCINTHKGLYRYNRLAFGVKSAPGSFQQVMDSMITGLDGTAAYLDDIIISGSSIEEHNKRLMALMKRINDYGFRIRLEKCTFLMERITFLGFVIDSDGRRPDPEKIAAIDQMPPPTNDSKVRSFLGLIQFYGSFVSELFKLRPPLDALTKKDAKFQWTPQCQYSFDRVKKILKSDLLLTHFDPNLPIIVAADASQYGIGAVISHRFPDGSEKAIYHISKALTAPQRNYSQIEKEAFGLITAVTKFHKFIYGRHFTLKTDHKPLLSIFGDKKGIPLYSANRLQRWAIILLNYDFSIEYVNTHDFGQADALSRLISEQIQQKECEDRVIAQVESEVLTNLVTTCDQLPVTAKMIRASSKKDPLLNQVYQYTISGSWPKISDKTSQLSLFHNRRDQLSIVSDCLMFNGRIVIPHALRSRVLKMLHRAHPGIVRMKQLARSLVYWPAIDKDIEKVVRSCDLCASVAKNPIKNTLCSWPIPTAPWQRVHCDYAGPVDGRYYLVIVDAFSKWPEVIPTTSITSTATINILRRIFAQFGDPETLVSDNGTQFTSSQFQSFCKDRGISHLRSPPFHPQSNGQAERFVDTIKRGLGKLKGEETTDTALYVFLQNYRSTPCSSSPDGSTPAQNFIGRNIRTFLDQLLPKDQLPNSHDTEMEKQFNKQHGARSRSYQVGEKVYVKNYRNINTATWISGTIQKRIGRTLYRVLVKDAVWIRHANQLRRRDNPIHKDVPLDLMDPIDVTTTPVPAPTSFTAPPTPVPTPPVPMPRKSTRITTQPQRLVVKPKQKSYN
ncbi:hypothetical protein B9Z55_004221 [Caenorhabditis nigoni]|uniref:RNA-directed DNA polymerase n=1 Tax=Caenorhabditis nigoni TaxID=1611254 RepID=A0A2G5UVH5_9PELO|nr:hypothetical protein B9Z55_004221 [Caenorhabditis nigoni]